MVALTKKSAMNYWETMLTHIQKMEYILYYTKFDCLRKEKYLNNCEMYARKLRIEILPILQLHLTTEEIKEIANKLMKISFKKLIRDKNNNANILYCDKYKNIIICQMYRFVALYPNKLPSSDESDDKHIWQQIIQKYVFNEIGFNCPQELIPKFITEIKKYAKQYIQQSKLENAKIFTLNTLIEKSELNEFGFNISKSSEQTCLLIPHTVTLELEHIKTTRGNKSKGDLWRVQKLCGSNGLLEMLCKSSGCDILGNEHGEAHLKHRHGNNDYTIISIALYYSKLLNKENNLGFVLITNDKVMYTIASGKNIPVVSLNELNKQLQLNQINNNGNDVWNASYLRRMFIKVGFVGGYVKKHLINNAINTLQNSDHNGDNDVIKQELQLRRNEIAHYMQMEQLYVMELLRSISLSNELIINLKDILANRDSHKVMKQIYESKVNNLELMTRNSQLKWSNIIQAYQSKYVNNNNNNNKNDNNNLSAIEEDENDTKNEIEEIKEEIDNNLKIYNDDDVPEINRFHADDMDKVNGNYVNVYDFSGDDTYKPIKRKLFVNKNDNDNNNDEEDSDIPPPLNEDDQQKLLEIKRNINNKKEKENNNNNNDNNDDNKPKYLADESVPLVGGFLAGEEYFSRQAEKDGFEEEVIIMTQEI